MSHPQRKRAALVLNTARFLLVLSSLPFSQCVLAAGPQQPSATDLPMSAPPASEDMSQLKLGQHALRAQQPFLIQRDEMPEFTREFFRVEWRPGDPIDLYVIRPAHVALPPVTLFLYGFPSETDRFRDNDYCRTVTSRGYAAVGFVSALTGQRFHGRGMKEWFVSDLPEALVTTTHDVQMILNYLESRKDLDTTRVGMLGQGSGGAIAVLAASVEPRLKQIDLMDPWGDWPAWLAGSTMILDEERPQLTEKKFLDSVAGLDPVNYLRGLDPRRVHLQDVSYDRDSPPEAKRALEAAMPAGSATVKYATREEFEKLAMADAGLLDWLQPRGQARGVTPQSASAVPASVRPQNSLNSEIQ